jgi:hypothetical protein
LPEHLYLPRRPFADDATQLAAWVEALQSTPPEGLKQLAPGWPVVGNWMAWLPFAEELQRLHRELAGDRLNFADVLRRGKSVAGFRDSGRWKVLAAIQERYWSLLDEENQWDQQQARIVAIDRKEIQFRGRVLLVGVVDLNRVQRTMLAAIADQCTALVSAPESFADRFDEEGCLVESAWRTPPLPVPLDSISVRERPSDQAAAVVEEIDSLGDKYSVHDVAIGVADAALTPFLKHACSLAGQPVHSAAGTPVATSSPYQLLMSVAELLREPSPRQFAAVLRHPLTAAMLRGRGITADVLTATDSDISNRVPTRLPIGRREDRGDTPAIVLRTVQAVHEWLEPLGGLNLSTRRPIRSVTAWARIWLDWFRSAVKDADVRTSRFDAAVQQIEAALMTSADLASQRIPQLNPSEALALALRSMQTDRIPDRPDDDAIEMLGWLELPLDESSVVIIAGMNEGATPRPAPHDPFLPDRLRRCLEIDDDARRWARDVYCLTTLVGSRRRVRFVCGRRNPDGDPLFPSRLLLLGHTDEIPRRVRRLVDREEEKAPESAADLSTATPSRTVQPRVIPLVFREPPQPQPDWPRRGESPRVHPVTSFGDYLTCPYRYYLRHELGLRKSTDDAVELSAARFGDLMHLVLTRVALPELVDETNADRLAGKLFELLDEVANDTFGEAKASSVALQIETMRRRLQAFAAWQAKWRREGNRILHVEQSFETIRPDWMPGGINAVLKGRIDRIDVNEQSGEALILDYKTGDSVSEPDKTHRRGDQWIDLQLPLYRHLVVGLGIQNPKVGYLAISKKLDRDPLRLPKWTEFEFSDADKAAADVVRRIHDGLFWPPDTEISPLIDDFAELCRGGARDRDSPEDNGDAEEADE